MPRELSLRIMRWQSLCRPHFRLLPKAVHSGVLSGLVFVGTGWRAGHALFRFVTTVVHYSEHETVSVGVRLDLTDCSEQQLFDPRRDGLTAASARRVRLLGTPTYEFTHFRPASVSRSVSSSMGMSMSIVLQPGYRYEHVTL
jgi:hypothetical protein